MEIDWKKLGEQIYISMEKAKTEPPAIEEKEKEKAMSLEDARLIVKHMSK